MKLIIEKDSKQMSESALHILLGAMMQDKRVNISLTAGKSPIEMYQLMIPLVKDKEQFKDIQYYLFDDAPYPGQKYGPNWDEMQELFFKDANIPEERIHSLTMDNWENFDQDIANAGGIDVMVIGLGYDGHFCSNSPKITPLDSYTYKIDRAWRRTILPHYNSNPEIPFTLTMGPKSLMKVKHLVMIVNGLHKASILKEFLNSPISDDLPATVLKLHPNFTIICDEDAAALINADDYTRI